MTEDTKMILEEMAKMEQRLNERMDKLDGRMDKLEDAMNKGFADTYAAIHTCHDTLEARIDTLEHNLSQKITDLQLITGQNCFELTLLKAKQA